MSHGRASFLKRRILSIVLVVVGAAVLTTSAYGQESLLNSEPYDQIVVSSEDGETVLDVYPLELPNRELPSTSPTGKLELRLVSRPGQTFEVAWSDIVGIRLFERRLLQKASELTRQKKFDEAFDYFSRLSVDYPRLKGLDEQLLSYLEQNALSLYQSSKYDRALAVLGALYARKPSHPTLAAALERVSTKIIQSRLKEQDYAGARLVLDLLASQFSNVSGRTVQNWRGKFQKAAGIKIDQARKMLAERQYVKAQKAARLAADIWPESKDSAEILAEIQAINPQVVVGVFESSPANEVTRLDVWSSTRVSRLFGRTLTELNGYGVDGGIYRSPFGELSQDESGRNLLLKLYDDSLGTASYGLARYLLSMADYGSPDYRSAFAAICGAIAVDEPSQVRVELNRLHVRPEVLLKNTPANTVWDPAELELELSGYRRTEDDDDLVRFEPPSSNPTNTARQVLSVVEQKLDSDEQAVSALIRGDISVIDHVPPWLLETLRSAEGIVLGEYRLPTLHVLIPQSDNPLLRRREFRRALCYGIARERILTQLILGGEEQSGFQVLSGPFPTGRSLSDPVRYAYDNQIEPRSYEPRLAATLAMVAASNVAKAKQKKGKPGEGSTPEPVEIKPLTLGHPSDVLAKTVCQLIAEQLSLVGIPIELKELTTDDLIAGEQDIDLRYAELAIWEPLADVQVLLGQNGLSSAESPNMRTALRELETASTWSNVRQTLNKVHQIAYSDLPVIPLWQTLNHFAHRDELTGVGNELITLYQNVEQWKLEF